MYILFDIGGTHMRIACSKGGEDLDAIKIVDTPARYEDGVRVFVDTIQRIRLTDPAKISVVAGGIAGPLDRHKTMLVGGAHLTDWVNRPFATDISRALGAPVLLHNDAAVVGLGEAVRGAGRHFPIVMYITVSTGVGGARIVRGEIDESSVGFEPGNQIVDADKTMIPGVSGPTLQDYISGAALARRTGKQPKDIHDARLWDNLSRVLAIGLNNTIVHWSPDVVVLGGSMITGVPGISVEATARHLTEFLTVYPVLPAIKKAELGDHGGLYGALAYARAHVVSKYF